MDSIQATLDENVRRGLMVPTQNGGYKLTERGVHLVEAMPDGGSWCWIEVSVMLRNYERSLAVALKDAGAPPVSAVCFQTLLALYREAPQKPSMLALSIGQPATSFTPILDRLEELDLIRRGKHPDDRRAIYIHLTEGGEALRDTLVPIAQQLNTNLWNQARKLA